MMAEQNSDLMCRICLNYVANYPIFNEIMDENSVYSKLTKCLNEKVEDIIGYPNHICLICKNKLEEVSEFIELFRKSQNLLKDGLHIVKTEVNCDFALSDGNSLSDHFDWDDKNIKSENVLENIKPKEEPDNIINLPKLPGLKLTKVNKIKEKIKKSGKILKKSKSDKAKKVAASLLEGEFKWDQWKWCLKSDKAKSEKKQIKTELKQKVNRNKKPLVVPKSKTDCRKLCDICGETFSDRNKLGNHKKLKHTDTQPLNCSECNKVFYCISNLRAHLKRSHSTSKEFICDQCSRAFAFRGELASHIKNVHYKHLKPKKIYSCSYCNKKYKCAKSIVVHERSEHTGHRPAKCTFCDSCFYHEDYLKEHMRLHTGETPFKCPVCGRGYAQRCNMKSHLRIHKLSELDETTLSKMKPNYLRLLKKN